VIVHNAENPLVRIGTQVARWGISNSFFRPIKACAIGMKNYCVRNLCTNTHIPHAIHRGLEKVTALAGRIFQGDENMVVIFPSFPINGILAKSLYSNRFK
jgi:hypothetical protein